jgi:hypothetical protein
MLLLLYFGASFLYDPKYVIFIKPLIIPLFILYICFDSKLILNKGYYYFVAFFYLGETAMLFLEYSNFFMRTALLLYLFSYLSLVLIAFPFIKHTNFKKTLRGYTLFVVLLNSFFLVLIVFILIEAIPDEFVDFLVLLNALVALMLIITSVLYLCAKNNKKAVLFFFGSISIVFSDIFAALSVYYLDYFALNYIERILHFFGFLLIYLFIIENKKIA